jgi:hypothetical protein
MGFLCQCYCDSDAVTEILSVTVNTTTVLHPHNYQIELWVLHSSEDNLQLFGAPAVLIIQVHLAIQETVKERK